MSISENLDLIPLGLLSEGEKGVVCKIGYGHNPNGRSDCCGGYGHRHRTCGAKRAVELGFRTGQIVEMKINRPGQPIVVAIENSQIALGRGIAMKILVQRQKNRTPES